MKRAFVVGHPIAHSRSPLIHGHWLKMLEIAGTYEPIDIAPENFAEFLKSLQEQGFAGGNVTIPHKEAAFRLADIVTPRAKAIGAANTLVLGADGRLHGDNTDALGFIAHLDRTLGQDWPLRGGGNALVLGAGGAARAIVAGLAERGVNAIRIANRTPERAQLLTAIDPSRVVPLPWEAVPNALARTGLLVNTTSLGMKGHAPLEIDLSPLPADAAVADIVYVPLETPLLAQARARDLAAVDGLGMLLHQAVPGFEAWFGRRPEVTPELRAKIVADLIT